jgi:hypothetical protein
MPTYKELYPKWNPDAFQMPGTQIVDEQVCVTAFKAGQAAVRHKGGMCPTCGQHVQVYRRSIYKRMAKCLIWLWAQYNENGGDWVSLKEGPIFRGGDNTKLMYWHLMVRHPDEPDRYKPTEIAVKFLKRELEIPKYAYVYNGSVQGFSKLTVSLDDCLEGDFDFSDLGIPAYSELG